MTSTMNSTPPRGVLSPRDVNTASSPKKSSIFTTRIESPLKTSQTPITVHEKSINSVHPQASRGVNHLGPDDIEGTHRPFKRVRRESHQAASEAEYDSVVAGTQGRTEGLSDPRDHRKAVRYSFDGANVSYDAQSPSAPASPASSFGSSYAALNDSQNTVLTEPDDLLASFPSPIIHRLTKREARERADALKLRLRLASYRVFTNQITTPWKDLEARTMPLGKLRISQSSPVQSPIRAHSRQLSQETNTHTSSKEPIITIPSSPPTGYAMTRPSSVPAEDSAMASLSTPLLPRHQEGCIISATPSFSMSNAEDTDLTDSAVKRSIASDGLLSLMRQQD